MRLIIRRAVAGYAMPMAAICRGHAFEPIITMPLAVGGYDVS